MMEGPRSSFYYICRKKILVVQWLGNDVGKGGVAILVKEELCESVVEIQKSDDDNVPHIWGGNDTSDKCLCIPKWKARYTEGLILS